jgi:alkylation response protein AidB-like acyl-CoA dehydrogenase
VVDVTFRRTDEQGMLASTLRELLGTTVDMDRTRDLSLTTDAFDRPVWDALAGMGLVGLPLAEEFGGADSPFTDLAVVFEELGRVVAAVPLLSTMMAADAIARGGDDEQRARWLPDLASGQVVGTFAPFESAHADATRVETTAEETEHGWRLAGTKRFVTDGPNADVLVVTATVGDVVSLFVVDPDSAGVHVEAVPSLDPTRPLADVVLDTIVPVGDRLAVHDAADLVSDVLDRAAVAIAAEQVGGAQRCLEMAVEYAKTRFQFGRAIGSFQAVKHRCADMLVAVEHARSVAWHAAAAIDDPGEAAVMVPVARSVCSDAYVQVAGDAIQVLGGIGFTWEHDAHLYLKRAKADSLILGSVGSARDRLASAIGV